MAGGLSGRTCYVQLGSRGLRQRSEGGYAVASACEHIGSVGAVFACCVVIGIIGSNVRSRNMCLAVARVVPTEVGHLVL
ncbi:uncharacterized protein B0H18DRAFT_1113627 [Fomitopsis serialis]|uniref:uncharacterized protein n=1 Tax=Fomitopsis serialis TaxID=139415 RepID=UPI0020080267|nr:uncharacterized protein B0H18DRAFT_1113627 [Neoantrodia serialis]KAH9936200.1 hypothetical protein B0H18DRAFT_1113627 [Neoantrodia serialis]